METSWAAFGVTLSAAVAAVESVKLCASKGLLSRHVSRKVMHIAIGPIFVACWRLFPPEHVDVNARMWATAVPLLVTAQFAAVGLGIIDDPDTVRSMSRQNDPRELLRGPLMYGIVHVTSTILWFRESTAVTALMILCAGDGFADLIGRNFGKARLPWSTHKTWVGSVAFAVSSFVFAAAFHLYGVESGWYAADASFLWPRLAVVVLVATWTESLPVKDWDNVTVFLATVFADQLVFVG